MTVKRARSFLKQNSTAIALMVLFNMGLAQMLLKVFIGSFPSTVIMWSIMFIFYLMSWRKTPSILTRMDVILISAWVLFLAVNVLFLRKEQGEYMIISAKTIILGTALYFLGKMASINDENYMSSLSWSPVIATVLFILIFRVSTYVGATEAMYGYSRLNPSEAEGYSQYVGYILLPNLTIAIFLALNGRMLQIPFMLILFIAVISSGARGALMCALLAGMLIFCSIINLRSWKSWLLIFVLSIPAGLVLLYYEEILRWFLEVFRSINLSSRVIEMLINGELVTHSSGRTDFYKAAIKGIDEYLLTGTGIYRDRQYLLEHFNGYSPIGYLVATRSFGTYSHCILLDFPLQFGLFMGSFILLSLSKMMIKVWRQIHKQSYLLGGGHTLYHTTLYRFVPVIRKQIMDKSQ